MRNRALLTGQPVNQVIDAAQAVLARFSRFVIVLDWMKVAKSRRAAKKTGDRFSPPRTLNVWMKVAKSQKRLWRGPERGKGVAKTAIKRQ